MADIYLLRITEAGRVVAQAKLEVFDKEIALRNFYETLPQLLPNMTGAVIQIMQVACSDAELPGDIQGIGIDGNHTGLQITGQMPGPSSNGNGHSEPNRMQRRHPA